MIKSTRNLHLVLFIGVMCVVQTLAQMCPYTDLRCVCDPPSLVCYGLETIPQLNTGVNVTQIDELTFQNGNITRISNNDLPPGLSSIYLYRHPLTDISEGAFDTSAVTLSSVSIIGAQFTNLPAALNKLTKLTSLRLEDTPIEVWDTTTLGKFSASLLSLQLSNVSLSAWPSWISEFHLLHTIDLSRNPLKYVPDDAFNSVKDALTFLDLSATGLTQVPHALSTLLSLYSLYLSDNNLTDVSQIETITGAPFASTLSSLYLNSVGLTRAANFSNLTSLRTLDLSKNRISDIHAGSLPTTLTILHLSGNGLSNVPRDVASMYRLMTLDLPGNFIANLEPNSFPSSLKYMRLDLNNLTIITNTTFRNLSLLSTLDLGFNPISVIEPDEFSDLVSLEYLFLFDSHLTEIPLAFTLFSPRTHIYWSTVQPVSCPCPTPSDLVQWYTSLEKAWEIEATCNNQSIDSYLRGHCVQTPATN